ncbi:exodeoxyribonuclease 7 small subunit [Anaplasma platys]|uniref:Exodeoxyribonuclease 7 small subunit n=1 Tax=Anaplasma platys TaxID=949 RepID=A0A858PXA8_9RICK|nr:exodeoxyribonuclease VII small subunit [Anaplasma platys]QJC27226.1 exodeoxyribonuclease 7 small subunit [Anaplasma platys]
MSINTDLKFEDAMQELERVVLELESSNVSLTRSIELYNRAKALHRHCDNIIKKISLNIELIDSEKGKPIEDEEQ